ncbi:acyltransferase domain-containing protein [Micromonospora sp. M12]
MHLGTTADADEIRDTARTQPLLVAAALLAAEHLSLDDVAVTAGHSVGELGAAALAGVLSADAAITLAGVRGREMAAACALEPTGMAAVLGGETDEVLDGIEAHGLYTANQNGAGQIVAAGSLEGLDKITVARPGGARVIRLQVAGAFHTPYMASAETALAAVAAGITPPIRPAPCCRTSTARRSATARRWCGGSSVRSPRRCAGTCACVRWPTSGSPA